MVQLREDRWVRGVFKLLFKERLDYNVENAENILGVKG